MKDREQLFQRRWLRLLARFCPPALYEGIEGDLREQYERDLQKHGKSGAGRRLAFGVLKFFRPGIMMRNKVSTKLIDTIMLGNYFKVASRNIGKRKFYSFVNAVGLSIGISFCTLIYLYIMDEKSFDQFHSNKDRISLVMGNEFSQASFQKGLEDPLRHSASMPCLLAEVIRDELPGVEHVTRFVGGSGLMRHDERVFKEQVHYVDSGFFGMFTMKWIEGSRSKLFSRQSDAVITSSIAEKYFGSVHAVGKEFQFGSDQPKTFTVAAVIADLPPQSSLSFGVLLPVESRPWFNELRNRWDMWSYSTFIQRAENTDPAILKANFDKLVDKYMGEMFKRWHKDFTVPEGYQFMSYEFVGLPDIHLNTKLGWEKSSNPQYSFILGGIAILILVIACINYVSLALTTSVGRRIEVGIRKAAGAQRRQVVLQFAFESMVLALISMLIGFAMIVFFLPAFNAYTGKNIELSFGNMPLVAGVLVSVSLLTGLLAGSYPAWYLSIFKPADVLKGRLTGPSIGIARPLVALQFAFSGFLIISSLVMYRQMTFIATKDLGFDKQHVLVIPTHGGWTSDSDRMIGLFREATRSDASVVSVTGTNSSFGDGDWSNYGYGINGQTKFAFVYRVDPYYLSTLGIELSQGRNFAEANAADTINSIIVNEALVHDMQWTDPVGQHLNWRGDKDSKGPQVIGVVKDYNFMSLESKVEPVILSMDRKSSGNMVNILVKISGDDMPATIEGIRNAWSRIAPDKPFEYSFLDENLSRQYESYEKWTSIMGLATVCALFIAMLGVFGLAGVNAVNRTKEIGIRKVLGAGSANIFVMLNKQFVLLSVASFFVAAPFSYYAMGRWLAGFQFRIPVGWELFAISLAAGLLVTMTTVSYHAFKAVRVNPADTLKYE
jgi:putative ABC transport system permease protein